MTALSKLPNPEAREACLALARATVWPAEEWAIALQTLLDGQLPTDEMGLTRLVQIEQAVHKPPSDIAVVMVSEYYRAAAKHRTPPFVPPRPV